MSKPLRTLLLVGPVLMFVAACAYGVLEVHSSTDTWIGLAAGKQIFESSSFPKNDTFSFTFQGEPWYNQNWLTHVWQYWLYSTFGPDAVIYGTWAMSAALFVLVLLACYWRSGTWAASLFAATVCALGCRDFLSARPATTGFFLMAAMWALVCALEGQQGKRRWWPIALLLPLLLVWGCAHGSFVFAYGMLGIYLLHWGFWRWVKPAWNAIDLRQAIGIGVVMLAALLVTLLFGPFGLENFIHGEKVAGSETFRNVSEWHSPFETRAEGARFPPVWRFWLILACSLVSLATAAALGFLSSSAPLWTRAAGSPPRKGSKRERAAAKADRGSKPTVPPIATADQPAAHTLHTTLYDVLAIAIGLGMTFWARRFAPIFFIFAAPIVLAWVLWLTRNIDALWRRRAAVGLLVAAWLAAIAIAWETSRKAVAELVTAFQDRPDLSLLERVTRFDATPQDALTFLRENELPVNLLVEWTQGGPIMFFAPNAKLFMDGRAQQVYDENTYKRYSLLLNDSGLTPDDMLFAILDGYNIIFERNASGGETVRVDRASPPKARTEGVLLRRSYRAQSLWAKLDRHRNEWVLAFMSPQAGLFLRRDSAALRILMERLQSGTEQRSNTPEAVVSRGLVRMSMEPPNYAAAEADFREAVARNPWLGMISYNELLRIFDATGRADEGRRYVAEERQRVQTLSDASLRQNLLQKLDACERFLEQRGGG